MKIKIYTPTGKNRGLLFTELLYLSVSSRVEGFDLIRLDFESDINEKRFNSILRILKMLKKKNTISLYMRYDELYSDSTESTYLLNLYPKLKNETCGNLSLLIKL